MHQLYLLRKFTISLYVFPSGEIILLDEDELKDALESGDITKDDFDLAYREANIIMEGMAKDIIYLTNMSYNDLDYFRFN